MVASPFPDTGAAVTHDASLRADHSQSRGALTDMVAVPPLWENVRVLADVDAAHRTVDGLTMSVWLVTPPHAGAASISGSETTARRGAMRNVCSRPPTADLNLRTPRPIAHRSPTGANCRQALHSPSSTSGTKSLSSPRST